DLLRSPDNLNYRLGMHDKSMIDDQRDEISAWTKYIDLGEDQVTLQAVGSFRGQGIGFISIPEIEDEDLFILRGFAIGKNTGHDHNIRKIGVRYFPGRSVIEAYFADDSPGDDEWSCAVFYTVVRNTSSLNTRERILGPFTTRASFTETTRVPKEFPSMTILSGFSFEYLNNDHFIRQIMIDPGPEDEFEVIFTDNERDNPVEVVIDYISYRYIEEG
ncbi:MAG: hypothetical protein HKN68_02900, partial [Saprospiraceae bacterium]|nr:hypothetical protein [Saprospiraceae bacterium]